MALSKQPRMVQKVGAPQHFAPLAGRELRAQAVHRLQIGMSGLAAMLLLVGLANIIMERARLNEAASRPAAGVAAGKHDAGSDPLADIGVAPAANTSASPPASKTGN